ncbi:ribosome-recycling factor [Striga asiatica]|uniref:Ribosome-recycling factor n=1 Tax=Striga asiatica TaxID=4170 RepID=A0A5A7R1E7_STRAF|nr:ribosome-recycling factor [Striga asiatica]
MDPLFVEQLTASRLVDVNAQKSYASNSSRGSQPGNKSHPCGRQPRIPSNKICHRKLFRLGRPNNPEAGPPHPPKKPGPGSHILILGKIQRPVRGGVGPWPLDPAWAGDGSIDVRLHDDNTRVLLPRASEERASRAGDAGVVDCEARVLARVCAAAGEDDVVGPTGTGLAEDDAAALEDGSRVTEDEVDCAVDVAVAVELAEGEGVEGVLVPGDAAAVHY